MNEEEFQNVRKIGVDDYDGSVLVSSEDDDVETLKYDENNDYYEDYDEDFVDSDND